MNISPPPASGNPTAATLRLYGDLLLAVRESLTTSDGSAPPSLTAMPDGPGTGPLPFPDNEGEALALWLDLRLHKLVIATSFGSRFELTLQGHSPHSFAEAVFDALAMLGAIVEIDVERYSARTPLVYDADEAMSYGYQ